MILNNKNINTEKQFRDNFSFKEVWSKLDIILVDLENISFTDKEKKVKNLERMKQCMNLEQNNNITVEEVESLKNSMEELYASIYSITNCSEVKKGNLFVLIGLLYQLAGVKTWDIKEILNTIHTTDTLYEGPDEDPYKNSDKNSDKNQYKNPEDNTNTHPHKTKDNITGEHTVIPWNETTKNQNEKSENPVVKYLWKQLIDPLVTVIQLLNSDTPYEIPCYDFDGRGALQIIPKKLLNRSDSKYGDVTIHIIGKENKVIQQLHLKSKEYIYINTINGKFLQVIPNLSISDNHIIYRCFTSEGRDTLKNDSLLSDTSLLYESKELENITHFTVDDENGFIGIIDKYIAMYSNLNFEELFDAKDDFVWICLDGSQYIILNKLGNLKTNFAFVHEWRDLISIYFHNNTVYGVKKDGRVISNKKSSAVINWKDIIYLSVYKDYVLGMNNAGKFFSEGFELNQSLSGQVQLSSKGYVALDENKLWLYYYNNKKPPYSVYSGVKEFAVNNTGIVMKDMNNALHFYDFESGQVRKLMGF